MGTTADADTDRDIWAAYPEEHAQVRTGEVIFLLGLWLGAGFGWFFELATGWLWWPVLGALCGSLAGLLVNCCRWGLTRKVAGFLAERFHKGGRKWT